MWWLTSWGQNMEQTSSLACRGFVGRLPKAGGEGGRRASWGPSEESFSSPTCEESFSRARCPIHCRMCVLIREKLGGWGKIRREVATCCLEVQLAFHSVSAWSDLEPHPTLSSLVKKGSIKCPNWWVKRKRGRGEDVLAVTPVARDWCSHWSPFSLLASPPPIGGQHSMHGPIKVLCSGPHSFWILRRLWSLQWVCCAVTRLTRHMAPTQLVQLICSSPFAMRSQPPCSASAYRHVVSCGSGLGTLTNLQSDPWYHGVQSMAVD